ncbi:hypothetical protein Desgi_4273 [Desulfoscipio gibsoniae DSM 7213]|uniref:Uncharacterized protein n=1 Tax=Desulfoscipio gibsoniae DSM 7213 TaxID=767817 RepID=R4KK20_9FIRM|nr:hypothetical protein Desgi_4273 [Desulfoscipio gibsoniae DSM 7213]
MMTLNFAEKVNKKFARYITQTRMFCCGFFLFEGGYVTLISHRSLLFALKTYATTVLQFVLFLTKRSMSLFFLRDRRLLFPKMY